MSVASNTPPGPPWLKGAKPRNIGQTLRTFLTYIGEYRRTLALIIVLGLVTSSLSAIGPQYLGALTDIVSASIGTDVPVDMDAVTRTALTLLAIYIALIVLDALFTRMEWITEEKIGNKLRTDLSRKIARISVSDMDGLMRGDILSRFVNDTESIRSRGVEGVTQLVQAVCVLALCVIAMVLTDWRLALATIGPALLGFAIIKIIVRFSQKYYRLQSKDLGRINSIVEETYRGLDVVTAYNALDQINVQYNKVNDELQSSAFKARAAGIFMPELIGFVNNIGYVLVCIVGSLLILEGESTFGNLVAFIMYVRVITRPMMQVSNAYGDLMEVTAAAERVFDILENPEMLDEATEELVPKDVKGDVRFEDVCFSYTKGTEIIHDLDLEVKKGQRIAIVGPTGAGKTTISSLLLRFYEPDSGSVSIDGIDIKDLGRANVRGLFGVVLQDVWLFRGTLRQNLVFDQEDFPDERIMEVCDSVGLGNYVRSLPEGLDTFMENPDNLSSGQKQQITIARAILKDAPLLIMDEATSSVDTRTEHAIQEAMDRLMENRTSFIIAHRLSTITSADRIIVINNGSIVESGTHKELIAKGGFYRSLYDSQFEFCA